MKVAFMPRPGRWISRKGIRRGEAEILPRNRLLPDLLLMSLSLEGRRQDEHGQQRQMGRQHRNKAGHHFLPSRQRRSEQMPGDEEDRDHKAEVQSTLNCQSSGTDHKARTETRVSAKATLHTR